MLDNVEKLGGVEQLLVAHVSERHGGYRNVLRLLAAALPPAIVNKVRGRWSGLGWGGWGWGRVVGGGGGGGGDGGSVGGGGGGDGVGGYISPRAAMVGLVRPPMDRRHCDGAW